MKYRFYAEALAEYEDAVVYYEGMNPDLGTRFILEVDDLLVGICEYPRAGSRVPDTPSDLEIRRRFLRTFNVARQTQAPEVTVAATSALKVTGFFLLCWCWRLRFVQWRGLLWRSRAALLPCIQG